MSASNQHFPINVYAGTFEGIVIFFLLIRDARLSAPLLTKLSSTQRHAFLLHLHVRRMTSETFYTVKLSPLNALRKCGDR